MSAQEVMDMDKEERRAAEAERLMEAFENDIPKSTLVTRKKYKQRSLMIRTKEQFCRLLSPVL